MQDAPVAVVGAGPAGLMAAERAAIALRSGAAADAGAPPLVDVFDAMPSAGRKFLLAGKGGLNLTHGEPFERFVTRYRDRAAALDPILRRFDAPALRAWAAVLGVPTFVGSSGRVFPADLKAAPLLRAWLHRLRAQGVRLRMRHRWTGWADAGALRFETPDGVRASRPRAVVLAAGGASWPRLGSDGAWVAWLQALGVPVAPLRPCNCGFERPWSAHLRERFAGAPLKNVALTWTEPDGRAVTQRGECVLTDYGIEGSLIYAASAAIRAAIERDGQVTVQLDLLPDRAPAAVAEAIAAPRGGRSLAAVLRARLGLHGAKVALLHELVPAEARADPLQLAAALHALPLTLHAPRPIAEAISSAGGVPFEALDDALMLRARPGVFCAGEMLDWEAPTGGYLLGACFATGFVAGDAAAQWVRLQDH
ncbi:MAG: TIGR03862 family flavoprotein [Rubrivivax sp.]